MAPLASTSSHGEPCSAHESSWLLLKTSSAPATEHPAHSASFGNAGQLYCTQEAHCWQAGFASFLIASIVELVPVQDAKQKREDLGVELYGFQQQLAKLQMQLEKSQEQHVQVSQVRAQARLDQQD